MNKGGEDMYKMEGILKNGATITIAEAPTMKEIEALEDGLEMDMMDPTSARIIFRNGHRMVLVKDISAVWITEE